MRVVEEISRRCRIVLSGSPTWPNAKASSVEKMIADCCAEYETFGALGNRSFRAQALFGFILPLRAILFGGVASFEVRRVHTDGNPPILFGWFPMCTPGFGHPHRVLRCRVHDSLNAASEASEVVGQQVVPCLRVLCSERCSEQEDDDQFREQSSPIGRQMVSLGARTQANSPV